MAPLRAPVRMLQSHQGRASAPVARTPFLRTTGGKIVTYGGVLGAGIVVGAVVTNALVGPGPVEQIPYSVIDGTLLVQPAAALPDPYPSEVLDRRDGDLDPETLEENRMEAAAFASAVVSSGFYQLEDNLTGCLEQNPAETDPYGEKLANCALAFTAPVETSLRNYLALAHSDDNLVDHLYVPEATNGLITAVGDLSGIRGQALASQYAVAEADALLMGYDNPGVTERQSFLETLARSIGTEGLPLTLLEQALEQVEEGLVELGFERVAGRLAIPASGLLEARQWYADQIAHIDDVMTYGDGKVDSVQDLLKPDWRYLAAKARDIITGDSFENLSQARNTYALELARVDSAIEKLESLKMTQRGVIETATNNLIQWAGTPVPGAESTSPRMLAAQMLYVSQVLSCLDAPPEDGRYTCIVDVAP